MWVARLKGYDEGNIYASKAIRYGVSIYYYPLNYYLEKEKYFFIAAGIVEGSEKNIKAFFNELKKDNKPSKRKRYVIKIETEGNFFICITAQTKSIELKKYIHLFYNPKFIHINPAVIDKDGYEEWFFASLERKDIEKLIKISEEKYKGKLLFLKESRLKNLGILSILPTLTNKQKNSFLLAIKNGYYEYPRQIELKKLAKLSKKALSTYQAHLRKAERKMLQFIAQKYF